MVPRRFKASLAVATTCALGLAARVATAEPVRVVYVAEPACPPESAFEAMVRARTARAEFAPAAARAFEVTLEQQGKRWSGALRVSAEGDGRASVRHLDGDSCDEVAAGLALVAALTIDPNASTAPSVPVLPAADAAAPTPPAPAPASAPASAPAPAPASAPAPAPAELPPPPPPPPPPPERPVPQPAMPNTAAATRSRAWVLSAGAAIESIGDIAPDPLLGAGVFAEAGLRREPSSPWLRLTFAFASSSPFAGGSPEASYLLYIARLSTCPVGLRIGPTLGALPCLEVAGGLIHASPGKLPSGYAPNAPVDVGWGEIGASAVVRWAPGERIYLDASVGAFVPIPAPPTFVLFDNAQKPHPIDQVSQIGPMASLAVGARFW